MNSSISEVDTESEVTQDMTKAEDISSLVTDPELRRRRANLASRPSTGSTVLLQEEFINNSGEKKVKEANARRGDKNTEKTYRPSFPVHKKPRESPLSSDAIFSQVICNFVSNTTYVVL